MVLSPVFPQNIRASPRPPPAHNKKAIINFNPPFPFSFPPPLQLALPCLPPKKKAPPPIPSSLRRGPAPPAPPFLFFFILPPLTPPPHTFPPVFLKTWAVMFLPPLPPLGPLFSPKYPPLPRRPRINLFFFSLFLKPAVLSPLFLTASPSI
ncbi:hypothetical protein CDSM653_00804 [Caldanaerobacter subterraneus subsp. pacificus DSM 12653]|uniref:Uncharacterized protein n=1 Tax=Caldanaerobacter subterraneus subsp. pacificus DSM 12653 TaxID=391606 RepID=A0A0F5PNG6_9THEO|nr:hypothetical protein CDSM653_00804 [Caldanaerobacter subterraneus subsp. pacificus DSM 12653]